MNPSLLAAADWFEILAALIFFLITGIAQWVQKRNQSRRPPPPHVPRESSPSYPQSPPESTEDWQEQLRRMLSGEETLAAPPRSRPATPPASLPPPLAPPPPTPARQSNPESEPTSPSWYEESEESPSWEERPAPERPLTTLPESTKAYERGAQVEATTGSRLTTAASLAAARQAFQQASKLHERVSSRMHAALARSEAHPSLHPSPPATSRPAQASLREVLRRPDSARRAILVATLLARPKGLEDRGSEW